MLPILFLPCLATAKLAVTTESDLQAGTVMIILDTSRSMIFKKDFTHTDKYEKAIAALKTVLEELPGRTSVGLVRFSGREGRGDSSITRMLPPLPHSRQEYRELIDGLGKFKPDSEVTPLARAIGEVANGDFFDQATGFKTILVLTDGEDNIDGKDAFAFVHKALGTKDISLQMVLFQAGDEEASAVAQFKKISELPVPGNLRSTDNQAELVTFLRNAMQPHIRVYKSRTELEESVHHNGGRGIRVPARGEGLENWSPALDPGLYYLRAYGNDFEKVGLDPGDRLILELKRGERGLRLAPYRYTRELAGRHPTRVVESEKEPGFAEPRLRLAVPHLALSDRQDGKGTHDLDLIVMMDRYHAQVDESRMDRPRFAWFELRSREQKSDEPPVMLNVENANYYPAPTWRLRAPGWKPTAGQVNVAQFASVPLLSAWWLDSFPAPAARLTRDLRAVLPQDKALLRSVTVDGDEVTIESVRIEDHTLIVQARHPKDKPILIQAVDLTDKPEFELRQAHYFYEAVGRYTARFGPLPRLDEKTAFTLDVHSLNRLRAEGRKLTLDLNMMPKLNDSIPAPQPVELK